MRVDMERIVIFGNSGSGKTTLSRKLAKRTGFYHLDLDTLAWKNSDHPERRPVEESRKEIEKIIDKNDRWIIEGCYTDLLEILIPYATDAVFLDIPAEQCIRNAKSRPFEPHKYASQKEQDDNLEMLIGWISGYTSRKDVLSYDAHQKFFAGFQNRKYRIKNNDEITKFLLEI